MKKITSMLLVYALLLLAIPSFAFASENCSSSCYIATTACPAEYIDYAYNNISKFILSLHENVNLDNIHVGTPFAFADADADVYYFPVLYNGSIKYLFRVYPDGNSYSAVISAFLADELNRLAPRTSTNHPLYLNLEDSKIVATIDGDKHILFEYPELTESSIISNGAASEQSLSVVDARSVAEITLNLQLTRDVFKYISLDITEKQGDNSWCTAYCLATIIRTQTTAYTSALGLMTIALGINPNPSSPLPWATDSGVKITNISNQYGLSPTVLTTTVSNEVLIQELNNDRPCIVALQSTAEPHSVVLRGYSSYGTWGIWNPWFEFYENFTIGGTYVPTGYSSTTYSYTPYMHAYNFG